MAASCNPDPKDRGLRLYINGKLAANYVMITMPTGIENESPVTIGKDLVSFDGAIDNLRYNRVLTDQAVRAIYEQEKPKAGK